MAKTCAILPNIKQMTPWPAWSHNGKWIAFASTRTGRESLYVIRPDGSGLRQVTGLADNQILDRVRNHNFESNNGYDGVADLNDNAWKVRTLAIRDLLRLGSEAMPVLIAGLKDNDRHVRHVCISALGILGVHSAGSELLSLLTEDPDPVVRGQAAEALGQIKYTRALSILKKVSRQDENQYVQHRAGLAISHLKQAPADSEVLLNAWLALDEKTFRRADLGSQAPDFELKDTDGKTWRLSDFRNKKTVVLIWIFADWCGVCHREFRDLIEMEDQFKKNNVQVFTIECHDLHRCKIMVGNRDLWWPHLVDNAGAVGAMYGVDPMEFTVHDEWINRPSTIIVDIDGTVKFAYYGTYWGDRPTIPETFEMIKTNSFTFQHPKRRK